MKCLLLEIKLCVPIDGQFENVDWKIVSCCSSEIKSHKSSAADPFEQENGHLGGTLKLGDGFFMVAELLNGQIWK